MGHESRQTTKRITLDEMAEEFRPDDVPEDADCLGSVVQDDVVGVLVIAVTWLWDLEEPEVS